MEDVLDLYHQPYDPSRPMVCMDETSKQLVAHTRRSIPAKPGQPERYDYEYERNGVANLFMFFEPLGGVRHVKVTERRTKTDWAECMAELVDVHYPKAQVIEVVLDNLNTHNPAALYEVYEPAEARRILRRLRFHYTPKHGSWLNMAEIELSALGRQCLSGRISDSDTLKDQVAAWEHSRNRVELKMDWRFTSSDARIKLKRLYPLIQD
jgi:transposase|tara:strand:+ start:575 stop:1201 length:627 start_codon:yes stop_codon:yes gene_type:complete